MKYLASIGIIFCMTGCAQYSWTHATKNEMQFNSDVAYCQNEALRNVQPAVAAAVAPIYTPPTDYRTNCTGLYNSVNCTTTSNTRPDFTTQIQQQNAQSNALLTTTIMRQQYVDNCMMSAGWSKQKITSKDINLSERTEKHISELKLLQKAFDNDTCAANDLKILFMKSPCNNNDISLAQLASNEKINVSEQVALLKFSEAIKVYINQDIKLAEYYILPPIQAKEVNLKLSHLRRYQNIMLDLYEGKLTWGEYNKKRRENASILIEEATKIYQAN